MLKEFLPVSRAAGINEPPAQRNSGAYALPNAFGVQERNDRVLNLPHAFFSFISFAPLKVRSIADVSGSRAAPACHRTASTSHMIDLMSLLWGAEPHYAICKMATSGVHEEYIHNKKA
jgi:hypothetical protein